MRLRLTTALLLASVTAAQAQHLSQQQGQDTGSTPASEMAARAKAGPNQVLDAASGGMASLYASPDDNSPAQPSGTQRLIRGPANGPMNGQVNGTPTDPVLHYPFGRYQPTLGNVDPNSLANPFVRGAPGMASQPSPFRDNSPGFSPTFGTGGVPAFGRGR